MNNQIEELKKAMTPLKISDTRVAYGDFEVDSFLTIEDQKLLKFKPTDLDTAFERNTGIMAYFGSMYGKAIKQETQIKTLRDAVEAIVADELRVSLLKDGGKVVETAIKSQADKEPRVVSVRFAYGAAQEISEALKVLCDAARRRGSDLNYFAEKATAEKQAKNAFSQK